MLQFIRDVYYPRMPLRYPFDWMVPVEPMTLKFLLEVLGAPLPRFPEDLIVGGVTCDSRKVRNGDLFIAIPGTKQDGGRYVSEAIARGCAAVVTQKPVSLGDIPVVVTGDAREAAALLAGRFYRDPSRSMNVIGITGTNGKSTTAFLIRSVLQQTRQNVGLLGTINYFVGSKVLPAPVTTPSAEDLQRYLWEMAREGCTAAVMEASSHALHQKRVHGVKFAAGLFTNLTQDHLDYHGTMEEYRNAKGILFRSLASNAIAVLNGDDPASSHFSRETRARVVTYGIARPADVVAREIQMDARGSRFLVRYDKGDALLSTRLIGAHNVSNILATFAACYAMGYDVDVIRAGIEGVRNVPGRLEVVDGAHEFAVYVDYAHTDDALKNVLTALRRVVAGRIILVFGCGGDRDRGKRPKMGRVASECADFAVVTSDNPRGEEPMEIIREIEQGMPDTGKYLVEQDRAEAIRTAVAMAKPGDAVLIAGKGHETYQIFRDRTIAFDDRAVAREILAGIASPR